MEIYMAVCDETNIVKVFLGYEELKNFAGKEMYAYTYFKLGDVQEIPDVDLFLKNNKY